MTAFSWNRVMALARKDAGELLRNPGAILPAIAMVFASLLPPFLVLVAVPMLTGERLEQSGDLAEFADEAAAAVATIPGLAGLHGAGLIQAFVLHQFLMLLLLVPVVGTMALATHAVIGEKQSKALEPLLATPISTTELLVAKTLTPFVLSLALTWVAVGIYLAGIVTLGEPGVWQAIVGVRLFIMFVVLGPLVELAALLVSVLVSSRAGDPRSAQQLTGLMVLPITAVFLAQLMGAFVVGPAAMLLASAGFLVLNAILIWTGVRVFQRETILTRWR